MPSFKLLVQIICGISSKSTPVNGDNTVCQSLDTTLLAYGVFDPAERQRVADEINTKSEALLESLIKYEETLSITDRGTKFGQTDLVGKLRTVEWGTHQENMPI